MLTTIPFSGFYDSYHDAEIDHVQENMFTDRETGCYNNDGLSMRAWEACNWQKVHALYAIDYCGNFADEFGIKLVFESLTNPREYNFTTDRIFAEIDEVEVRRIYGLTPRSELDRVARENFTSRSGFISFYPSDVGEWSDLSEWDHNQVGTLIEAYVKHVNGDFNASAEFDLMERSRCNGFVESWIAEATPGVERFYRVHDYLQKRAERCAA